MTRRRSPLAIAVVVVGVVVLAVVALVALGPFSQRGDVAVPSAGKTPTVTFATPTATTAAGTPTVVTATASPQASQRYTSPLGYSVELPAGWRRSDLQSRATTDPRGDPELVAIDVFTVRTPSGEQDAISRSHVGLGPAQFFTAYVRIDRNSRGLSARALAEREQGAYGNAVVSIEDTTVQGRPAAKITWRFSASDPRTYYATYVREPGGRIWVIGFYVSRTGDEIPPGATEDAVRGIVESFRFS